MSFAEMEHLYYYEVTVPVCCAGRTYYFNAATNVTQWDPPAELAKAAGTSKTGEESGATRSNMAARKSMLQRRGQIAKRSTVKPQTASVAGASARADHAPSPIPPRSAAGGREAGLQGEEVRRYAQD